MVYVGRVIDPEIVQIGEMILQGQICNLYLLESVSRFVWIFYISNFVNKLDKIKRAVSHTTLVKQSFFFSFGENVMR